MLFFSLQVHLIDFFLKICNTYAIKVIFTSVDLLTNGVFIGTEYVAIFSFIGMVFP